MSWVIILIYIAIAIVSLYFGFRAGVWLIVTAIRKDPNKMLPMMGIRVVRRVEHEDTTERGSRDNKNT